MRSYNFMIPLLVATLLSVVSTTVKASLFPAPYVTIHNTTDRLVWAAYYHATATKAIRSGKPFELSPMGSEQRILPSWRFNQRRLLFIANNPEDLSQKIEPLPSTDLAPPVVLGLFGTRELSVMTEKRGLIIHPTEAAERQKILDAAKDKLLREAGHYQETATISTATDTAEQRFISARRKTCRRGIEKILGRRISPAYVPHISVCASGGGFRAMLATLGTLCGLAQIEALNCVEYAVGVSGGAWALFPWVLSKQDIATYTQRLSQYLQHGLGSKSHKEQFAEFNALRNDNFLIGRTTTVIDLYGIMLANVLLEPLRSNSRTCTLEEIGSLLHPAQHPFPIACAVTRRLSTAHHDWLEYSPFSVTLNTDRAGCFGIPSWAVGREWWQGHSQPSGVGLPLSYHLATWGSAFSVGMKDIIDRATPTILGYLPEFLRTLLTQSRWSRSKWFSPFIPNFTRGVLESPYQHKAYLHISDGGVELNMPLNALLREDRPQDLIIMIDSGRHLPYCRETIAAVEKQLKARYPACAFDTAKSQEQAVTYFPAHTENTPSILYIRLQKDDEYDPTFDPRTASSCNTIKFSYTQKDATQLVGLLKHTVTKNTALFKQAISEAYQRRKAATSYWQLITSSLSLSAWL